LNLIRSIRLTLVAAVLAAAGCSSSSDAGDGNDVDGQSPIENPSDPDTAPIDPSEENSGGEDGVDGGDGENPPDTGGDNSDPTTEPAPVPPVEPPTEPPIETRAACMAIDVINVGTGSQRITIELNPGERAELTNEPRGTLISVDETLGEIQYVPPLGRAPDTLSYNIVDSSGAVVAQEELTLRLDPIRVMPLGDSITHGVEIGTGNLDTPPVPLRVGYRQSLLDQLAAAGQVVDFTGQGGQRAGADAGISDADNNGYPGVDISFINDRVQEVFDELPSDVALLHIGTNLTPNNASGIDAILDNIDAWEAANFPVTVFVATLIPKRDPALQQTVDQFNADLRLRVAARLTDRLVLVEQADAVTVLDIDPSDVGVHPTAPGYLRMADTWYEAMAGSGLFPMCDGS